jgi:hypothetical protein
MELEKIIERVYYRIFLPKARDMSRITGKFNTVNPPRRPSYHQWCREFNVSMLHGRTIVHIENHS